MRSSDGCEAKASTCAGWCPAARAPSTLRFRRYDVEQARIGFSDRPAYSDSQAIAHHITELYAEEEVDQVIVVYNHFESPPVQRVVEQEILPIPESVLGVSDEAPALVGDLRAGARADPRAAPPRVCRDRVVPGAAGVRGVRARSADDGDAQRLEERGGADRQPDAGDEPGPPGRRSPRKSSKSSPAADALTAN